MTRLANLGFIGCGTHASNNLFPMVRYAKARLQAVCDLDLALAARNARIFGGLTAYSSVDEMLAREQLDGVMICGGSNLHFEAGCKALRLGLPIFVEKPPAPSLAAAQEMAALAKENKAFVMTGFMKRHGLAYKKIRSFIAEGRFQPAAGSFRYLHWPMHDLAGMMWGMSIHPIDLAISFFGEVAEINAVTSESPLGLSLGLTMRFTSGQFAQLMLGSAVRIQERVEITGVFDGKPALFIVDNAQHLELHTAGQSGIDVLAPELYEIDPTFELDDIKVWRPDFALPNMGQNSPWLLGYAGEVREFAAAILEEREPYPGTDEGLKAMAVIEAVLARPNGTTGPVGG